MFSIIDHTHYWLIQINFNHKTYPETEVGIKRQKTKMLAQKNKKVQRGKERLLVDPLGGAVASIHKIKKKSTSIES